MTIDRIASFVFMLVALVFWSLTRGLSYNGQIFPRLVTIFLFVLSAVMFAQTFSTKHPEQKQTSMIHEDLNYIIRAFSVVILWVSFLNILGFIVTSVVCLSILTLIIDLQKLTFNRLITTIAIYTVVVTVFWVIFHRVLLVPLPVGYFI